VTFENGRIVQFWALRRLGSFSGAVFFLLYECPGAVTPALPDDRQHSQTFF